MRIWNNSLTLLALLVVLGVGVQAQPLPQGVVVNPTGSALKLELWPSKGAYASGERLGLSVRTNVAVYLYLYAIDERGQISVLFPNAFESNNHVGPGLIELPGERYSWVTEGKPHVETVQALASVRPFDLLSLAESPPSAQAPYASLKDTPRVVAKRVQALIDRTLNADEWVAAWTQFRVLATPPRRFVVRSRPPGAETYLDGAFVGLTPATLSLSLPEPANRGKAVTLTLVKRGYKAWSGALRLRLDPGGRLHVQLPPEGGEGGVGLEQSVQANTTFLDVDLHATKALQDGFSPSKLDAPVDFHRLRKLGGSFALNLGGHPQSMSSFGLELGLGALKLGLSLADTAEKVPAFFDLGTRADLGRETVYNLDPEFEFYAKLSLNTGLTGIALELGAGVVTQTLAHVATPVQTPGPALNVSVLPNGYLSQTFQPTAVVGVAYRVGGLSFQAGYDTHRGAVGGLGVLF